MDISPYAPPIAPVGEVPESYPLHEEILSVWVDRHAVTERALRSMPVWAMVVLSMVYGVDYAFRILHRGAGSIDFSWGIATVVALNVGFGLLVGPVLFAVFGLGLRWIGGWLGGRGSWRDMIVAQSVGALATVPCVLLWMLVFAVG